MGPRTKVHVRLAGRALSAAATPGTNGAVYKGDPSETFKWSRTTHRTDQI